MGKFDNGKMIAAKPTRIAAERCNNGIKELKFSEPKENAPTLKYERPTNLRHSGPENFKKSRPKKLVKSNKPISRNFFFTKYHFFAISKMAKNQFLKEEKV